MLLPNVSDAPTELDKGMLRAISRVLSSLLGNAALFGFDVIRQVNTGRLAIIDINHFPGYHGCFTPGEFFEMIMAIAHTRL